MADDAKHGGKPRLILSINAGSSSVKLSLYSATFNSEPVPLVSSSISGLTSPPATFSYAHISSPDSPSNVEKQELKDVTTQDAALRYFLEHMTADGSLKELESGCDIDLVCHRIVHGGDFDRAMVLSNETIQEIEDLTELAPLHNAPALGLVHIAISQLPRAQNIAYFDTTFHSTLPPAARTYMVAPSNPKVRRYGFHGISYAFILHSVAGYLGQPVEETSLIVLHLGSGASACAIRNGLSIDTSMGLTPAEGLPGATRSGTVDPTLVFHTTSSASSLSRASTKDMHITKAEDVLNKHSGWSSLAGTTDFAAIVDGWEQASEKETLAFEIMVDRIVGYVGSYWTKLGGECDALVFSGGIGEKSWQLRREVAQRCACLGFKIEERRNIRAAERAGVVVGIGGERMVDDGGKLLVCRTDEEGWMARECAMDKRFW